MKEGKFGGNFFRAAAVAGMLLGAPGEAAAERPAVTAGQKEKVDSPEKRKLADVERYTQILDFMSELKLKKEKDLSSEEQKKFLQNFYTSICISLPKYVKDLTDGLAAGNEARFSRELVIYSLIELSKLSDASIMKGLSNADAETKADFSSVGTRRILIDYIKQATLNYKGELTYSGLKSFISGKDGLDLDWPGREEFFKLLNFGKKLQNDREPGVAGKQDVISRDSLDKIVEALESEERFTMSSVSRALSAKPQTTK